jgi:CubicO group peptidase (beta-lactamase class C family)
MNNVTLCVLLSFFSVFCSVDETPKPFSSPSSNIRKEQQSVELIATKFDSLFSVLSKKRGFNGNVLVAQKGKILYKNAFGFSDLKRKIPLNIQSVFQIASVSKQFTSVAIMMLHDQGKIEFADSVQKFFPAFPYKDITIRHLLSHRSGLPNYMYFAGKYWKNKRQPLTNEDVMEMMGQYKPIVEFKPDRKFKYSNTGYVVLAAIVEKISGMPFHVFMEENIFKPLEMKSTFVFDPADKRMFEFETKGYSKNRRLAKDDFLSGVSGDKGIYSTIDDMFKWDQALYTEKIVKQSTLDEAFTPASYDYKHDSEYGYGWRISTLENGDKIVYHAGLWRGYNSFFARRLSDHTAIIVLCNKVNWSFRRDELLFGIIDSAKYEVSAVGGD